MMYFYKEGPSDVCHAGHDGEQTCRSCSSGAAGAVAGAGSIPGAPHQAPAGQNGENWERGEEAAHECGAVHGCRRVSGFGQRLVARSLAVLSIAGVFTNPPELWFSEQGR